MQKPDEYFVGKNVLLVGPAPNIEVDDISKYDCIVRLNHGYPVHESIAKKTTGECHVLYLFWDVPRIPEWHDIEKIKLRISLKRRDNWHTVKTKFKPFWNKLQIFEHYYMQSLQNKIGCKPNTGLLAMIDILNGNPNRLYITGISFYKTKYHYSYVGKAYKATKVLQSEGNIYGHDQDIQLNYFYENIYPINSVFVDSTLKGIMEEHENSHTNSN